VRDNLRASDVIRIIGVHMDYLKTFDVEPKSSHDDDWSEEDLAEGERIVKEIEAKRDSEEGAQGLDEQGSESDGSDEDRSENSEGDLI
jgi:hypothetical protein